MTLLLATAVSVEFSAECSLRPTGTLGPYSHFPGSWSVSWRAGANRQSSAALPAITKADEVAGRPHQPSSPAGQRARRRWGVRVDSRQEASSRVRRFSSATERLACSGRQRPRLNRASVPTTIATSTNRLIAPGPCVSASRRRDNKDSPLNQLVLEPLRSCASATAPDGFVGGESLPLD